MEESQKNGASTAKTQKRSSISDEFGTEFLSSWKSSVSKDDEMDFMEEVLPKGKKSAFNFDKLDMDFSLDGDFGKKMSSFNVDMSDLDFSSPPKKPSRIKEISTEESLNGKQGGKQSRFSFDFDFNDELESHQPMKEKGSQSGQATYINQSVETKSQLNSQSTQKNTCSISKEKTESVFLSPADPIRQVSSPDDAEAGNQKVDNTRSHEPAITKHIPIMEGNGKNDENSTGEPERHQPMKVKESCSAQSRYINQSVETQSQLNSQSSQKNTCSISNKKTESVLLSSIRQICTPNDAQVGNQKVDNSRTHEPAPTKGVAIMEGNGKNDEYHGNSILLSPADQKRQVCSPNGAQAGDQEVDNLRSHEPAVTKDVPIMEGNGKTNENHGNSTGFQAPCTRLHEQKVSTTPKSLNSKLVSSIAAIRSSKNSNVEGNNLYALHPAKKTLEASSLKVSRFVKQIDVPRPELLTEIKSSKHFEKITAIPYTSAKMDHTVSVEKQGFVSPSMKRKVSESPNADPVTFHSLKRATALHSDSRERLEISERLDNKRVRSTENLMNGIRSSPILNVPRVECWKELEVPILMENDGIVEKAEAYGKELDDICSMLKKKHEEAKEALVCAIVNNNNLLMLNHPIYEEKISMVQRFATLMLSPEHKSLSTSTTIKA